MSTAPNFPEERLSIWYHSEAYNSDTLDPAQAAFQEGLKIFKETLTNDPEKKRLADQLLGSCTAEDVRKAIVDAKNHYDQKRRNSKLGEYLVKFSQRLMYYGNIVDVLVQQHPEYVCLAWATMKLVLGAVIEHERTGTTILAALCEISDTLPTVELAISLHRNAIMKRAVSVFYAHIVKFLIRAWMYYQESKVARAVHSVTRPATLRYDDLIKLIQRDTETIWRHAVASNQVEQRDFFTEVQAKQVQFEDSLSRIQSDHLAITTQMEALVDLIGQLRQDMVFDRALQASSQLQIRTTLSDLQMGQALSLISSQCTIKHTFVFQSATQLQKSRQCSRGLRYSGTPFWTSPKLREWNTSPRSSAILIKSVYREGPQTRGFCTEVVEQLVKSRVVALWVLVDREQTYPLFEVLKSLVLQALGLSYSSHVENQVSYQLSKFVDAHFEQDYLEIIGSLLQHFKLVYIIANAEAMSSDVALQCRDCLSRLSRMLLDRGAPTILKIITTWTGPEPQNKSTPEDLVLNVGKTPKKKARKQMKGQAKKRGGWIRSIKTS